MNNPSYKSAFLALYGRLQSVNLKCIDKKDTSKLALEIRGVVNATAMIKEIIEDE